MTERIAICPGSFDPITLGHLDILSRAAACFDKVYMCVMVNCDKKQPMFSQEKRLELIRKSIAHLPNVEAELFSGLLADYARAKQAHIIVKGVRNVADFESEAQMARINQGIDPQLETLLLPARHCKGAFFKHVLGFVPYSGVAQRFFHNFIKLCL